jgi:hypothetical protein
MVSRDVDEFVLSIYLALQSPDPVLSMVDDAWSMMPTGPGPLLVKSRAKARARAVMRLLIVAPRRLRPWWTG